MGIALRKILWDCQMPWNRFIRAMPRLSGDLFLLLMSGTASSEGEGCQAAQKKYLDFLKLLFKDRAYVSLAYMTGILPIKKY